jgi:hypothetical protein
VSDAARRRCAVPPSARRDSSRRSPSACGLIDSYIERAVIEAPPADEVAITYQPEELTELDGPHLVEAMADHAPRGAVNTGGRAA